MSSNTSSPNLDLKREADPKMLTNGHSAHGRRHDHPPPRFLQIKQEDKFFSRLLSKEYISSKGNGESSFRVMYYGGAAGTVLFMWESQPGTPKHTLSDTSLPPLTPPPSYQFSPKMNSVQKCTKPRIFHSISLKLVRRKPVYHHYVHPRLCRASSCLSSNSLPSMNVPFTSRRKCIPRSRSAIYLGLDEEDDNEQQQGGNSPTSTLCFGARNGSHGRARVHYPVKNLRKAFLSIVGRGNA